MPQSAHLAVTDTSVVQDLQQKVEHIHVGLLHLVKQHHRVGTAAHLVGNTSGTLWRQLVSMSSNSVSC